jgi:hypothetical protein
MAGLCTPLPTLRRHPHGHLRTAWGRCGSLTLHRSIVVDFHHLLLAGQAYRVWRRGAPSTRPSLDLVHLATCDIEGQRVAFGVDTAIEICLAARMALRK